MPMSHNSKIKPSIEYLLMKIKLSDQEWELDVGVSEIGSQSKGHGFESRLLLILHENDVKAMPGWIPVTSHPGSFRNRK